MKASIDKFGAQSKVSAQDNYEKHFDSFQSKIKDPTFKNNSYGVSGILAGGYSYCKYKR